MCQPMVVYLTLLVEPRYPGRNEGLALLCHVVSKSAWRCPAAKVWSCSWVWAKDWLSVSGIVFSPVGSGAVSYPIPLENGWANYGHPPLGVWMQFHYDGQGMTRDGKTLWTFASSLWSVSVYLYLFRGLFSKAKVFENFEIPPRIPKSKFLQGSQERDTSSPMACARYKGWWEAMWECHWNAVVSRQGFCNCAYTHIELYRLRTDRMRDNHVQSMAIFSVRQVHGCKETGYETRWQNRELTIAKEIPSFWKWNCMSS